MPIDVDVLQDLEGFVEATHFRADHNDLVPGIPQGRGLLPDPSIQRHWQVLHNNENTQLVRLIEKTAAHYRLESILRDHDKSFRWWHSVLSHIHEDLECGWILQQLDHLLIVLQAVNRVGQNPFQNSRKHLLGIAQVSDRFLKMAIVGVD